MKPGPSTVPLKYGKLATQNISGYTDIFAVHRCFSVIIRSVKETKTCLPRAVCVCVRCLVNRRDIFAASRQSRVRMCTIKFYEHAQKATMSHLKNSPLLVACEHSRDATYDTQRAVYSWHSTTPTPTPTPARPTRLYIFTSDTCDFLARKSVSVSASWNASLCRENDVYVHPSDCMSYLHVVSNASIIRPFYRKFDFFSLKICYLYIRNKYYI